MNPEAQEELDRILKLNPEDLSPEEKAFLNARRSYLNNEQKRVFDSVLTDQAAPLPEGESELPSDPVVEDLPEIPVTTSKAAAKPTKNTETTKEDPFDEDLR